MILFHSKDDIGALSLPLWRGRRTTRVPRQIGSQQIGFPLSAQLNYHASGDRTNRACCRSFGNLADNADKTVTRAAPHNPIVMIPSRLASTRLPGKPLADIGGKPMIVRVWRRAVAAGVGPVVVACGDRAIADAVEAEGGNAVMTGSDRIAAALASLDPGRSHDAVINVQGDLPTLDPAAIRLAAAGLADPEIDIATLGAAIADPAALADTSVNKVVAGFGDPAGWVRALYFSKAVVPWGEGPHYEHIGLYAYRREALERFVTLPRGVLELRERLEQLRALENGMTMAVALIEPQLLGVQVDTPADLERARAFVEQQGSRAHDRPE
jgi:3-deoxy-manno-octulosonate cytidylyltransferase (CMP-KDO synthetase)